MIWQIRLFTAADQSITIELSPEKDRVVLHLKDDPGTGYFSLHMSFEEAKFFARELIKYTEETKGT